MTADFTWTTDPFEHQRDIFTATADLDAYALFWEVGCGKTKPTIDTACYRYLKGDITLLVIIAPNIVHDNWVTHEIPKHGLAECDIQSFVYYANKASTNKHIESINGLISHKGLSVLAITYDAICTDNGKKTLNAVMRDRKTMLVADEIHRIKSGRAERTKATKQFGKHKNVIIKRGLTGTPITNRPFDVYHPMDFLEKDFWAKYTGINSFMAFKTRYAEWSVQHFGPKRVPKLERFIRLDELRDHLTRRSHALTKEEAGLKLPPKVYMQRVFDMSPHQRRIYDTLVNQWIVEIDAGKTLEAPLAMVRLLRLHQVACGYAHANEDNKHEVTWIQGEQPRMSTLLGVLEDIPDQVLVWTRFREDARAVVDAINARSTTKPDGGPTAKFLDVEAETGLGGAVRVDGSVPQDERLANIQAWRDGKARILVANPKALGTGITLTEAKTAIYYSQDFELESRIQSEGRPHRIGQDRSVTYIDLIARDTIDSKIVESLMNKAEIANQVVGTGLRAWLRP